MANRAHIDGQEFDYILCPEDATYLFQVDNDPYRFRQWTWGEKNRVIDAAVVTDAAGNRLRLDIARFNELMLAASLVQADTITPLNTEALRQLHPVLGDTLLSIAYWVNELPSTEKNIISALHNAQGHPELTTFRLCQEFGWTPRQVQAQRAVDIEKFILILNELERIATLVPDDEDATTILISDAGG